jgi:hypothetical protein
MFVGVDVFNPYGRTTTVAKNRGIYWKHPSRLQCLCLLQNLSVEKGERSRVEHRLDETFALGGVAELLAMVCA